MTISSRMASVDDYLQYVELRGARTKILGQSTPLRRSAAAIGERSGSPVPASPTFLIEIATIMARGLAGQLMKCGGERAGVAEADIERNPGDGQRAISQ